MHEARGILTWKNSPSFEQAWFLVHLSPHGPKSIVSVLELLYLFSSLQMVSGQQIPEACIKNFVIVLRLVVHIPALRGIGFEDLKSRIPKCVSSFYFVNIYFNIFFRERFIYLKKFYFLVFTKFYLFFLSRSRLWWNRMNINKGAFFLQYTYSEPLNYDLCLSCMSCDFFSCVCALVCLQYETILRTCPSVLKVFLQGLVHEDMQPKSMIILTLMVH